jgi:hypothetical protein
MSKSNAIHSDARHGGERRNRRRFVVGAALGLLVAVLAFATVHAAAGVVRATVPAETAVAQPAPEFPARELPAEWQWKPRGVQVEHMYRNHAPQRLDWIR